MKRFIKHTNRAATLGLALLLLATHVMAGLTVTRSNGIAVTGADGVTYINASGIAVTGADGFLALAPNGIAVTGADGIAVTGADGLTYIGANGIAVTGADGIAVTGADGIAVTGADGIAVTGADGKTFHADSITIQNPQGIAVTGADGIAVTGADGYEETGPDSFDVKRVDGIAVTGADGIAVTGADGIAVTGADGRVYSISPGGIAVTGADDIVITYANGIAVTGADGIAVTGADGIAVTGADSSVGLQSLDPELALALDRATDDSNINAVIVYHHLPTEADIADLQRLGIMGGVRYLALPMIALTATKPQLINASQLPAVRSIYGNRTLQLSSDPFMSLNNAARIAADSDLTELNRRLPVSGQGVAVAVLDTGVDAAHPDLAGRVSQNVKLLDTLSMGAGFINPVNIENLSNTDNAYGHGTFVAGVIAGSGSRSSGRYAGVAPGASIVGLSAGDLTLSFVLAGFDYLLTKGASLNVRAVNCSFSANTVFDLNDPVNVATRILTDSGVNVVFSAGNTGPGMHTLNPFAVAPWVISVGATDERGRLADFSSRGAFANGLFHPTLVAPGVSVIGPRAVGVTGVVGLLQADTTRLTPGELPDYTTASGTSFSAPQVAATIAMMLESNPALTPAEVRDIIQRTATPLPEYYYHEVGAGMLNAHAAVLEAAFPDRRMGVWRAALDRKTVEFINDPPQQLSGTVAPGEYFETSFSVPEGALLASAQIAWGPLLTTNDLGLTLIAPNANRYSVNKINLPGLTGRRERLILKMPVAGIWRARVNNSSKLQLTSQPFTGAVEITRAQYASLKDVSGLDAAERSEVYQTLRTRVMEAKGARFRPEFEVTRASLAEAMVYGARVPQYLASHPYYSDVRDLTTRNFVESVQLRAGGALFPEDGYGRFRPNNSVDRLTAAIVLVRAAGLGEQAEAQSGFALPFWDSVAIPAQLRGYVSVALERGLMTATGSNFRPQSSFTRIELAHAMVALQRLATE